MFLSLCFRCVTCKEKTWSAVKQAFTLGEACQFWLSEQVDPEVSSLTEPAFIFLASAVGSDHAQHLQTLPKKPYHNTRLFNFMQWNLFSRCSTESAWQLVMWQQFRETINCKLSLIIKARTETSIPGLKPVSLWFSRGRQDQEFKAFLSAGSQVQLYTSVIHKDGQSISLKLLPHADCMSRAEPVAPSLSLLQDFWDLVLCTIINAHLCLRAPF